MLLPPPLSLYIHFPWCVKKCPYCDFNSHTLKNDLPEEQYITALLEDLQHDLTLVPNRELISIFMGGGTPSLFSPPALSYLITEIKRLIPNRDNIEITLEANPGTVEQDKFKEFFQAGINRLSIGVQSFQNQKLSALGRIHDSCAAIKAAEAARQAGYANFNIDLMFGLPQQTLAEAMHDLAAAIQLQPSHISWYQLTLEPNTLFYHQPPSLPNDELIGDMQNQGQGLLKQNRYHQYEISAYSQTGFQCTHNRNYWEFGDYLGIGAGAHGKITDITKRQIIRTQKHKHPKDYLDPQRPYLASQNPVASQDLNFEFMLNHLRLKQTITYELFEQRTFLPRHSLSPFLQKAKNLGLINLTHKGFAVSPKGWQFLNNLIEIFLP